VLGGTVLGTRVYLAGQIRQQLIGRDASVLHAVTIAQLAEGESDVLEVALRASRQAGVLGLRLFDEDGRFVSGFPPQVTEGVLSPETRDTLAMRQPVSRYVAEADLAEYFLTLPAAGAASRHAPRAPLLEIAVPLHRPDTTNLLGSAQFLIEGRTLAREFATLDRNLRWQALLAFGAGSLVLAGALGWAFRRLQRANDLLADRTRLLIKANEELTIAAKTSAVGALTAHLIHGLKNPLAGLSSFIANRDPAADGGSQTDWQAAVSSTQRMQDLVSGIVRVLQEEQSATRYDLTGAELAEVLQAKLGPASAAAGVALAVEVATDALLPNRDANLVLLILENLVQNAIQATPQGGRVGVRLSADGSNLVCSVTDQGPGLTQEGRARLFEPVRSSKAGGSGIGLAISRQLARALGADLKLQRSDPSGCEFLLVVPGRWQGGVLCLASPTSAEPVHLT
jgi:signal transduction histidine kinase